MAEIEGRPLGVQVQQGADVAREVRPKLHVAWQADLEVDVRSDVLERGPDEPEPSPHLPRLGRVRGQVGHSAGLGLKVGRGEAARPRQHECGERE